MSWSPRKAYIVSHTHWDREWYLTYEEFRVNMIRVVDRVLDALDSDPKEAGAFVHFLLDGQSVLLEDYLEVRPDREDRLRRLISEGRLSAGPWYILPDEFLVSGEATARNLLIGTATAARLGRAHASGYMPDSFGHLAQMPQILHRAGLDSFVFTRGLGDEAADLGWRFRWTAPDGSEVLAVNQCSGYCNAGGLGFQEIWHAHTRRDVDLDRAVEQLTELFEKMSGRPGAEPALINNGCDHFPPQQDFARVLEALRTAFPDTEFVHTDLPAFVEAASADRDDLPVHRGELLGGRDHFILSGVWSARMPLKQENARCQDLLSLQAEPLAAYGRFMHGLAYPTGELREAWKLLLKNHPHDSICGCSVDGVHRDMHTRFAGVRRTGKRLLINTLENLTPNFARREEHDRETTLCLANPLPRPRREVVTRMMVLQPFVADPDGLRLFDEQGAEVPFTVLEKQYVERFWGIDYRVELHAADQHALFDDYRRDYGPRILKDGRGDAQYDCYWTIQFEADLPACGHAVFRLRETGPGTATPPPAGSVRAGDGNLENDLVRVTLHPDGAFDLEDKRTGRRYAELNRLADEADIGDEYDFCACDIPGDIHPRVEPGRVRTLHNSGLQASIEVDCSVRLPARIVPDRTRRDVETVDCPFTVRLTLHHDSPRVDVRTTFDNRACDHRLRAEFPTVHRTRTLVSDGQFLVHERPLVRTGGDDWAQPQPATWPQQDFSCVEHDGAGLALLNLGLPEIEGAVNDGGGATMLLTLLRSVGWLSRDDFPSRKNANAGPTLATPDAQCLGEHVFDYAVMPYTGDWRTAGVIHESRAWRTPPLTLQGVEDLHRPGDSLLACDADAVAVTAIKRHEERDTLVVRAVNLHPEPADATFMFGRTVSGAWRASLLEERGAPLVTVDGRLPVTFTPHEIVTLEIDFGA